MLAVAAAGQSDQQAAGLVALVETKARNLGLHNPRGRMGRHVLVRGAWTRADPAEDDIECLLARARSALKARGETDSSVLEPA
jgi:hypothetical protein